MFTCMIAYLIVPVLIKECTGESLEMGVEGGGGVLWTQEPVDDICFETPIWCGMKTTNCS